MDISPIYAAAFGIFMGMAFLLLINRWVLALILAATGRDSVKSAPVPPPNGRFAAIFPILLFHSGTWALVLVVGVTLFVLLTPHKLWWLWFFGAFYAVPLVVYPLSFGLLAIRRTKNAKRNAV
jgi:hypothetical protein